MAILKYLGKDNDYHSLPIGDIQMAVMPMNYSTTDEIIIGQWINGKPIYKRTVKFKSPGNTSAANMVYYGDWNVDVPIYIEGLLFSNDNLNNIIPINFNNGGGSAIVATYINSRDKFIRMSVSSAYISKEVVMTMYYTKTTDAEGSFDISQLSTLDLQTQASDDDVNSIFV